MPGLAIDKASFTSQLALDAASDAFSDPPPDLTDDQSLQDQEESSSELSDPPEGLLEGDIPMSESDTPAVEAQMARLHAFNFDTLLVTVQLDGGDTKPNTSTELDLDFVTDPLSFWQCWKYSKRASQVRLHLWTEKNGPRMELQRIEGVENAALWGLCRESARKEIKAIEKGAMQNEMRRLEGWRRGSLEEIPTSRRKVKRSASRERQHVHNGLETFNSSINGPRQKGTKR